MPTSRVELEIPLVSDVAINDDSLGVELDDGRTVSVPLAWFPRLLHGSRKERADWRLIGKGLGIHWEALDEDISVENLLAGKPSGESLPSFERWLAARSAKKRSPRRS